MNFVVGMCCFALFAVTLSFPANKGVPDGSFSASQDGSLAVGQSGANVATQSGSSYAAQGGAYPAAQVGSIDAGLSGLGGSDQQAQAGVNGGR
uniref:Uncharacterized protein n=1 Tax=Plectus sambesii TaxID=2011161 RepID=A0A914XKX7_9BILA